jgi:hypothetical protein
MGPGYVFNNTLSPFSAGTCDVKLAVLIFFFGGRGGRMHKLPVTRWQHWSRITFANTVPQFEIVNLQA